ncbi:MAG: ABC transporter permease [Thermostichales cyanobacterium BF4_bins_65]
MPDALRLLSRRLLLGIPVLVAVSALSFLLLKLSPGDFLDQWALDPSVGEGLIAQERARLGLDQPWWQQYFTWLGHVLRGDLGRSFSYRIPVSTLILSRAGNTLILSLAAVLGTWLLAVPLGVIGALGQDRWWEKILRVVTYIGQAIPSFIVAIALLFVAQHTGWFPVGGMTRVDFADLSWPEQLLDLAHHLLLPAAALSITSFAGLQRITRGSFLDVLRQDYLLAAQARGIPKWRQVLIHALRNAVNPLVTILGFEFASLLSGSFIAEFFFNWPGLGKLLLEAVQSYDINVVMAGLMLGAVMLMLGNVLADLALQALDPRIRIPPRG